MILRSLSLQNFRSYSKAQFILHPHLTIVVGPNASGKTNLVEAIALVSTGKSFRAGKEKQLIAFGETIARVKGVCETEEIEIIIVENDKSFLQKRYMINGVSKRRSSLAGIIPTVFFTPLDLSLVAGQPGDKRHFLDEVLEQTDQEYAASHLLYTKALRQRNALLEFVQKTGRRDPARFAYWDNLLINHGQILTQKREAFIAYINSQEKQLFHFIVTYDKSLMSQERLLQYKEAEVGAGMTLVGPQRDDLIIQSHHSVSKELEDVKYFCSRGQQRLVALELKKAQISYLQEQLQTQPILVLDDIFSELDAEHIEQVLQLTHDFQTIITTTHKEFIATDIRKDKAVIELKG